MMRIIQLVLFISIFFLGFLALNFYNFYVLGSLFTLPRNGDFYALVFLAALLYPVAAVAERSWSNRITNLFYTLASSWIGIAFFLLWALIIYQVLNFFVLIPSMLGGGIIIAITLIISLYAIFNAYSLHVKEVKIPINGLGSDFRILQLSDVHIGPIRNQAFIEKMVDKCNSIPSDLVVITGDLFDGSSQIKEGIVEALNKIKGPVIFIPGNHDYFQGLPEVLKALERTNIRILRNQVYQMGELQILGVDYSYQRQHLEKTLKSLSFNKEKPCLLLYHLPDEIDSASKAGVDLQLSGHTHHGQFYPFNLLVKIRFPYLKGLYKHEETFLYVSPGTGTWGPPMRLGSRNQITSITLTGK
jgi:predicted MPP superfamily phosphohydrolase